MSLSEISQQISRSSSLTYPNTSRDYDLEYTMASGAFGTIYKAHCSSNDDDVAIKIIPLTHLSTQPVEKPIQKNKSCDVGIKVLKSESSLMDRLRHPNVINHYTTFISKQEVWIIMELCKYGSCGDIMAYCPDFAQGFKDPLILSLLLKDVVEAVKYLHSQHIIHRDIKPCNILINKDGRAIVTDFGVSTCLLEGGIRKSNSKEVSGTPYYMAPELLKGNKYDYKVDIWSIGISALELAFGKPPFHDQNGYYIATNIIEKEPPTVDSMGKNNFDKTFKKFVANCLHKDGKKRSNSDTLLHSAFFKPLKKNKKTIKNYILDTVVSKSYKYMESRYKDNRVEKEYNKDTYSPKSHLDENIDEFTCKLKRHVSKSFDRGFSFGSSLRLPGFDIFDDNELDYAITKSDKIFKQITNSNLNLNSPSCSPRN